MKRLSALASLVVVCSCRDPVPPAPARLLSVSGDGQVLVDGKPSSGDVSALPDAAVISVGDGARATLVLKNGCVVQVAGPDSDVRLVDLAALFVEPCAEPIETQLALLEGESERPLAHVGERTAATESQTMGAEPASASSAEGVRQAPPPKAREGASALVDEKKRVGKAEVAAVEDAQENEQDEVGAVATTGRHSGAENLPVDRPREDREPATDPLPRHGPGQRANPQRTDKDVPDQRPPEAKLPPEKATKEVTATPQDDDNGGAAKLAIAGKPDGTADDELGGPGAKKRSQPAMALKSKRRAIRLAALDDALAHPDHRNCVETLRGGYLRLVVTVEMDDGAVQRVLVARREGTDVSCLGAVLKDVAWPKRGHLTVVGVFQPKGLVPMHDRRRPGPGDGAR